jgi:tetratricopeptide (TPR) repeat protein
MEAAGRAYASRQGKGFDSRVFMRYRHFAALLLLFSLLASAQEAPPPAPAGQTEQLPERARAYYHYALAHLYQELMAIYGRGELAARAVAELRRAMEADPGSSFLQAALAELYAKTGRIRDAVMEAQTILQRDPENLEARKLLGRIYLRSLGDTQAGPPSQEMLRLAIEQFEHIVRLEPQSTESRLLLGRLYRLNNNLAGAEEQFRTAAQMDPGSEEAVTTLAYFYNEQGQPQRAIETLNRIAEAGRSARLYAALGFTYEQQKDHANAIAAYTRSLELEPENMDAMRGLAQNLYNDGQAEAALERYRAIAAAEPQDVQSLLRMAEIQRRLGDFEGALASLERARALIPEDSLEIPYNIVLIYQTQGRFAEAAALLEELLQRTAKPEGEYTASERNNRAIFLERLGIVYKDMNQREQALAAFRQILDLGDDNAPRAFHHIIETYRDARMWQEATETARAAVARFPEDRQLKMVLGAQLVDHGEVERGLALVRSLLKGGDGDRDILLALGQIHSRLRRWKEAEQYIGRALDLSKEPHEREYALFIRASLFERQKKHDQAEAVFQQLLASNKDNHMVLNYLGYMLADRNVRLQEALGYIRRAVELDPQNGAYLDSLGWVYFRLGDYELAEQYLLRANERTPNDGTILDHIGDLYARTGRLRLAITYWERALAAWEQTVAAEVEPADVAAAQKKLEAARVRLAKQGQ